MQLCFLLSDLLLEVRRFSLKASHRFTFPLNKNCNQIDILLWKLWEHWIIGQQFFVY